MTSMTDRDNEVMREQDRAWRKFQAECLALGFHLFTDNQEGHTMNDRYLNLKHRLNVVQTEVGEIQAEICVERVVSFVSNEQVANALREFLKMIENSTTYLSLDAVYDNLKQVANMEWDQDLPF